MTNEGTTEVTTDSQVQGTTDTDLQTANNVPEVRDFTDNDLVRVPGMQEPVKYGDLYKRLQADHTRKTTEAARIRAAAEQKEKELADRYAQQEAYVKNLAAQLLARQNSPKQGQSLRERLAQEQFLSGKSAAEMFAEIEEKGFGTIVNAIQERDKVIQGLYNQILNLQQTVNNLHGSYASSNWEGRLRGWLKEGGYPEGALDLAKEIYLAYEGDDLDNEFPTIFQNRWNQIQSLLRAQDQERVKAAKKAPFKLPGKGGTTSPGNPIGLKGNESAKEIADLLWESVRDDGPTT